MAPSETTSFFKVILSSTLQEGKMKFPKKFAKERGGELPETIRLCLPTGRCWSVRIERETDNDIWLHDGLLQFMEDNSIGTEYILVFKYDGNSEFGVLIFDLTAEEIQYTCIDDSINRDNVDQTLIAEMADGENGSCKCARDGAESDDSAVEGLGSLRVGVLQETNSKCASGGEESDDSAVVCLGSLRVSVLQETNKVRRSYFTRRRKQVMECGIKSDRSMCKLREATVANVDNLKTDHPAEIQYSCIDDSINHDSIDQTLVAETGDGSGKCARGGAEIDDCAGECLGSSRVGVLQGTNVVRRCYVTRRRKQAIEGCIGAMRSLRKRTEANGANEDSVKTKRHVKNSTAYKDTGRNDGTNVSPSEPINKSSPHFFKVTLKPYNIEKRHLSVPCDFGRLHISDSTRLIKLVDAENNGWVVRYIHRGYTNCLSSGWGCFVRDKKLMVGDVCIFERVQGDDEVKLRVTISRSGEHHEGSNDVKLTQQEQDENNSTIYKDTRRNDGADASPSEPINKSLPNFFKITLKPCYLEKGHLYVPRDFALLHMSDSTRLIKLVDAEDNEWLVSYVSYRGHKNYLNSGWRRFVQDKKLMVGDVCIFERVQGDDEVKLRVTISRSDFR